jgi:hypothetical protein
MNPLDLTIKPHLPELSLFDIVIYTNFGPGFLLT